MLKQVTRVIVCSLGLFLGLAVEAADMNEVVTGGNEFAVELYGRMASKEGNLFFSPASIHTALGMTYAGARGRTAQQMAETLRLASAGDNVHKGFAAYLKRLNSPAMVRSYEEVGDQVKATEKPAYELVMANALWGQKSYPWKKGYLQLTSAEYGAGLREVDFTAATEAARQTINAWVQKETKERIKDLVPPGAVDVLTRLVLTNAIYFKATWAEEFSPRATKDKPFNTSANEKVVAPLMFQKEDFRYAETETVQVLEMPYVRRELAMVVVLPRSIDGLPQLESSLSSEMLKDWLERLRREEVEVTFPRFQFTSAQTLRGILEAMGIKDAFSVSAADFSGMTAEEAVFISEVIHKAFAAVDEKGTEAAAATAVVMAGAAAPVPKPEPKVFKADHPFLFLIRHNATGSILFMGRLVNPKK